MSFKPIENFVEHITDDILEPQDFICIFDEEPAKAVKSNSDKSTRKRGKQTSSKVKKPTAPAISEESKKASKPNSSKTEDNSAPSVSKESAKKESQKKKTSSKAARRKRRRRQRALASIFAALLGLGIAFLIFYLYTNHVNTKRLREQMDDLRQIKEETVVAEVVEPIEEIPTTEEVYELTEPQILPDYQSLYDLNNDMVGWLSIEGTIIDYPVMQTKDDESFYLKRDFYKEPDKNGCLLVDDESTVGIATKRSKYAYLQDGMTLSERPSTNIIIHGHTMSSGDMFGDLDLYKDKEYGLSHKTICFDTLYEHREYELISVFYSKVYRQSDEVFKYYKFFEAYSPQEFYDWYYNILDLSLYDTGTVAVFGDEFITLSCCAYHTKNGRFVVVGKRVM